MVPFKALYRQRCMSPMDSFEVRPWGTDYLRDSIDRLRLIHLRLLNVQSRKKSYANYQAHDVSYMIGDQVLLKVSPINGVI